MISWHPVALETIFEFQGETKRIRFSEVDTYFLSCEDLGGLDLQSSDLLPRSHLNLLPTISEEDLWQ